MTTYSETHQGLERVLAGFGIIGTALSRTYRDGALQLFVVIGLATAAAATATAWLVAPIEGAVVYEWIGVWTLVVMSVLVLARTAAAVARWAPGALSQANRNYLERWREERLLALARQDYRVAQEIRAIRSRDQSDR